MTVVDRFTPVLPGAGRPTDTDDDEEELPTSTTASSTTPATSSTTPLTSSTPVVPVVQTTPTTTSTTPLVVATSSTPVPVARSSSSEEVSGVTTITSYVRATPSASAGLTAGSSSGDSTTNDDNNTGAIIGGIIGGIAGIAALAFIAVWLVRRKRRRDLEDIGRISVFNPSEFRKSAVLVRDNNNDDWKPPAMAERKALPPLAVSPDPYRPHPFAVPAYHDHGAYNEHGNYNDISASQEYGGYNYNANYSQQHLHTPGTWTPTPGTGSGYNSANPFMNPAPYNQSPFHDPSTPVSAYADSPVNGGRSDSPTSGGIMSGAAMAAAAATAAAAAASAEGVVLAQIGGTPVLTRANSNATVRHKPSNLSISVPGMLPGETATNLQVIQGGEGSPRYVTSPQLIRKASSASTAKMSDHEHQTVSQDAVVGLARSMSGRGGNLQRKASAKALERSLSVKSVNVNRVRIRNGTDSPPELDDDTVDLTRASVSPYQAQQYAEISKRLNADVPQGMPSPLVEQYVNGKINQDVLAKKDLPPLPPPSPYTPSPTDTGAPEPSKRTSVDSVQSITMASTGPSPPSQIPDFPIPPPSPAVISTRHQSYRADIHEGPASSSSHSSHDDDVINAPHKPWTAKPRVDSTPPQLPDFALGPESARLSVGSAFGGRSTPISSPAYPFGFAHGNGSNASLPSSAGHHETFRYHKSFLGGNGVGAVTVQTPSASGFTTSAFASPTSPNTQYRTGGGVPFSPDGASLNGFLHPNGSGSVDSHSGNTITLPPSHPHYHRELNGNAPISATAPFYPSGITAGGSPFLASRFPVSVGNSLRSPLAVSFEGNSVEGETSMSDEGGRWMVGGSSVGHGLVGGGSGSSLGHGSSGLRLEVKMEQEQEQETKKAEVKEEGVKKEKERPVTVYDPEDAYGGI